ncbi:unnamed protein product, partial [Effrenium voratum]
ELLERQGGESGAALQALRVSESENGQQLERVLKMCGELSDARIGMVTEVENCRAIQRQLEDALRRVDARLESVSSVAAQCSGGLVDAKAFAQSAAEKALANSKELLELKASELKELVEKRATEATGKLEALKAADAEQRSQLEQLGRGCAELSEHRRGMQAELEQCRTGQRQQEDLQRRLEARCERQALQLAQATEGVSEAKAAALSLWEQRGAELKDVEQRLVDTVTKLEALRSCGAEQGQQLAQLQRGCAELGELRRGAMAEIESCQSAERKLEEGLRRLDARMERVASLAAQCSEGTAEVKAFARELAEKSAQQWKEMLEARTTELKESLGRLRDDNDKDLRAQREALAELSKSSAEAQELSDRHARDTAAELQALKGADGEQRLQLERLGKACGELADARRG